MISLHCFQTTKSAFVIAVAMLLIATPAATAQDENSAIPRTPFRQQLGDEIPNDVSLTDHNGQTVQLADYLGERPLIVAPVYYECPMLCNEVLNGLGKALENVSLDIERDFHTIAFSFDPREAPALAAAKRRHYLERFDRTGLDENWDFLTADAESIARLTDAIGFEYRRDPETGEFAHPAGIVIVSPSGKISRYLFGIDYAPRDLRLALVEASNGKVGDLTDQIALLCFRYDPSKGKYSFLVFRALRIGGVLTVVALGGLVYFCSTRTRRARDIESATPNEDF